MNTLSKTLFLLLFLASAGCSKTGDINSLIGEYRSSGDEQDAYKAINLIKETLYGDGWFNREWLYDDEIQSLADLGDLALSKENYRLFVEIYEFIEFPISDSSMKLMSDNYQGKDGHTNDLIAKWDIKQGKVNSAFKRLETAALDDSKNADAVHYLLIKYGCMDTASIWAELSNGNYSFMSSYDAGGEKYPAIPTTLNYEEIVNLRIKLRKGSLPNLQPDCPIHNYS